MGKYTDIPDKELIKLANGGDKEACMELSIRFREGTLMLAQNFSKAEYWRKQAVDASDYAGEVYFEDGIDGETEYVEYLMIIVLCKTIIIIGLLHPIKINMNM